MQLTNQMTMDSCSQKKGCLLRLKPYIQPFEKYLAKAELVGLVQEGGGGGKRPFSSPAKPEVLLSDRVPTDLLFRRLAYWESINNYTCHPTLQVILESDKGLQAFRKGKVQNLHRTRKLRYGPHGLHEYRGKFFPQLVKSLINFAGLPSGSVVLDPMCGSGTTNCVARSIGMRTLGIDLNPLSVEIARTKTAVFDIELQLFKEEIRSVIKSLRKAVEHSRGGYYHLCPYDQNYLLRWFAPNALKDVCEILNVLNSIKNELTRDFLKICLSNIVRTVSWQKDTDLRVRKEVKGYSDGKAFTLIIEEIEKNFEKITFYLSCFPLNSVFYDFTIKEGDSRYIDKVLRNWVGQCDLIITSPPYATALPYIDTDRLSLLLLGLLPRAKHREKEFAMIGNREISERQRQELWDTYLKRRSELPACVRKLIEQIAISNHKPSVGFRRRNLPSLLAKYFVDMSQSMRSAWKMTKAGCYAFYVVGNNSTKINGDRIEIPTNKFLWAIGKKVGWKQKKMIDMELLPSRDIFCNNKGTSETILWFEA